MKKTLIFCCICLGVLGLGGLSAAAHGNGNGYNGNGNGYNGNGNGYNGNGAKKINSVRDLDSNNDGKFDQCDNFDPCATYQTGPATCYQPVTKFRAQQYCTQRCVKEPYTVTRKHCRQVPQYYTRQFCRYVPQYYEKTFCRYVPQEYTTCETRYRDKTVTDTHTKYVPYCEVEQRCCDLPCAQPACPKPCPQPACDSRACGVKRGCSLNGGGCR